MVRPPARRVNTLTDLIVVFSFFPPPKGRSVHLLQLLGLLSLPDPFNLRLPNELPFHSPFFFILAFFFSAFFFKKLKNSPLPPAGVYLLLL